MAKNGSKENPLTSIIFNIAIPSLVLYKMSSPDRLGPLGGLLLAIAFPIFYGAYDYFTNRKHNLVSILGFVSIFLTGIFGLFKLEGIWFAVKEASVPSAIGLVLIGSMYTRNPLVRSLLYNEKIINIELVNRELELKNSKAQFEALLKTTTYLLTASFILSAVLNFALARILLVSPAGTEAFNQELAKMTALSYPVIAIPSMSVAAIALWKLLAGIKKLTGLELEAVFNPPKK